MRPACRAPIRYRSEPAVGALAGVVSERRSGTLREARLGRRGGTEPSVPRGPDYERAAEGGRRETTGGRRSRSGAPSTTRAWSMAVVGRTARGRLWREIDDNRRSAILCPWPSQGNADSHRFGVWALSSSRYREGREWRLTSSPKRHRFGRCMSMGCSCCPMPGTRAARP